MFLQGQFLKKEDVIKYMSFNIGDKVYLKKDKKKKSWIICKVFFSKRNGYYYELIDDKGKLNRYFYYEKDLVKTMKFNVGDIVK